MKTQVAIVGAGPAGLLLGHLLRQAGIDALIVERQSRAHVEGRIRAGVLEDTTTDLLVRLGIDGRMQKEGLPHGGFNLADGERLIRIDIEGLTGRTVMVYGQTELTQDLIDAAPARGLEIVWEASAVTLHDIDTDAPYLTLQKDGRTLRVDARFIAGCDGFHGPSRANIPESAARHYERGYPFGWLGILADVPPCNEELIYANHERGFALASMRSLTRSRYYIQVPIDEPLEDWPDERFWDELETRLGPRGRSARHARAGAGEIHRAFALLRVRADAPRQPVPRRRRGAHRAADRGQGPEPGGLGRRLSVRRADRVVPHGQHARHRRLLGARAGARVESGAFFLAAHEADAPVSRRRPV